MKNDPFFTEYALRNQLLREAMVFVPEMEEEWLLTYTEKHTFFNLVCFHMYRVQGRLHMRVQEVIDHQEMEIVIREYVLDTAESVAFAAMWARLKRRLPFSVALEGYERDGSRQWLSLYSDRRYDFHWEVPGGNDRYFAPILALMLTIDEWGSFYHRFLSPRRPDKPAGKRK